MMKAGMVRERRATLRCRSATGCFVTFATVCLELAFALLLSGGTVCRFFIRYQAEHTISHVASIRMLCSCSLQQAEQMFRRDEQH